MPVQLSYPGVYVEEIPSGVRTITGVATSVAAFIGRTLRGPVNQPTNINSFGDFERQFGGLWIDSTMSYAVRDFYQNGGSQAIIVRIESNAVTAEIQLPTIDLAPSLLTLQATSPGEWANNLSVAVDYNTADPTASPSSPPSSPPDISSSFNLTIYARDEEGKDISQEEHLLLNMDENSTRYLPRVLQQSSALLEIQEDMPGSGTWTIPTAPPAAIALQEVTTEGGDGDVLDASDYTGSQSNQTGLYALEKTDLYNLLCIPPPERRADTPTTVYQAALAICYAKRAMLLVDAPFAWGASPSSNQSMTAAKNGLGSLGLSGNAARNAALYFPRVQKADPNRDNQLDTFVPCGIVAGIMAQTDTNRGVWKSPAGTDAALNGIQALQVNLSDLENGQLNPLGINCFRYFPTIGRVVWGARTLRGADVLADEYKYIAPRRTALFIEESLHRGLKWVVFEPNDEPLWGQIRLNVGAFMQNLFRQGAFQGKKNDAYFVKCDSETTTQTDINSGVVNVLVGFAPLKPAEFVVIKLQQMAGQIEV